MRVLFTGCSGGGKSTLLAALTGVQTFAEPGRDVVRQQLASGGTALPWIDMPAFAARCMTRAIADFDAGGDLAFYDRGFHDNAIALSALGLPLPIDPPIDPGPRRYDAVILFPPWPGIYQTDSERRHGLESAMAEYDAQVAAYAALGYDPVIIPRLPVDGRKAWLSRHLGIPL